MQLVEIALLSQEDRSPNTPSPPVYALNLVLLSHYLRRRVQRRLQVHSWAHLAEGPLAALLEDELAARTSPAASSASTLSLGQRSATVFAAGDAVDDKEPTMACARLRRQLLSSLLAEYHRRLVMPWLQQGALNDPHAEVAFFSVFTTIRDFYFSSSSPYSRPAPTPPNPTHS